MMNLDAIRKTTVCYWSADDESYVVESSLFDSLAGVGDSEEEAMQSFEDLLSDAFEAFHEGRVPKDRAGRPSKDTVPLNTDVKPETKEYIAALAKDCGCSQGEAIDFIALGYDKKKDLKMVPIAKIAFDHSISSIKRMLAVLRKAENDLNKVSLIGLETSNKRRKNGKAIKATSLIRKSSKTR